MVVFLQTELCCSVCQVLHETPSKLLTDIQLVFRISMALATPGMDPLD